MSKKTSNVSAPQDKNKKTIRSIILSFFGIILIALEILIPVATSFFDDIQIHWYVAIFIVVLIVTVYCIACAVAQRNYDVALSGTIEREIETISRIEDMHENDSASGDENACPIHGHLCCVAALKNSAFYKNALNHTVLPAEKLREYNLMSEEDFERKEESFFSEHKNGEIWIISSALETEFRTHNDVRLNSGDASRVTVDEVRDNLNDGKRYVQFVALGPHGEDSIAFKQRRSMYWSALPDLSEREKAFHMPVIRIDSDFSTVHKKRSQINDPDWAYMIKLTSTIIFIDESTGFYEGYFYLRPEDKPNAEEYETRAIIYKMPSQCMLTGIVRELSEIKRAYFAKLMQG